MLFGIVTTIIIIIIAMWHCLTRFSVLEASKIYFLIDSLLLNWVVITITFYGLLFGVMDTGDLLLNTPFWAVLVSSSIFPVLKFIQCGYFRLMIKYLFWPKWGIIITKISMILGCSAYFLMGLQIILTPYSDYK